MTYNKIKIKLSSNVDFSYKKNALSMAYDDESTPELWAKALITDKSFSFMFFGDEQFDKLSDEDLIKQMKDFANEYQTKKYMNISNPDELDYHLYRYRSNDTDIANLVNELRNFLLCRPLSKTKQESIDKGNKEFVEYKSWNGSEYDVILAILITLLGSSKKGKLTPRDIRMLSNWVISCKETDWKKGGYFEQVSNGLISKKAFQRNLSLCKWSDGHIDLAKLAKSSIQSNDEKTVPPGLKKEMARFGLDIVIDDAVSDDNYKIWPDEELNNFVKYHFNDVLGTKEIGNNNVIVSELTARDAVRILSPYTAARAVSLADIDKKMPPERDITSASLASLVLIGPNEIKPEDYTAVSYDFPIPYNNSHKVMDLLDYIISKEKVVPEVFKEFFGYFRNKDTRDYRDDLKVKNNQPITHAPQMNMPYYYEGKPIDAYIRFSTGGAHGSTCANLHLLSPNEIEKWIREDIGTGRNNENRFTVDKTDVIHIDFTSFYPIMAKKMKLYQIKNGVDYYSPLIDHRVKVKAEAEELKEQDRMSDPRYNELQSLQLAFKLVLNAATGAGNMHRTYAKLPLDNKTLSMRLIGNMLIWVLGQRLASAGAYIISTNTDGLFICNMTQKEAKAILEDYIKDYDMPVEPEKVKRFINATTSTRIEFDHHDNEPSRAGGTLGHAIKLKFSPFSLGRNVSVPLISANAVIEYMANNKNWLTEPYDRSWIKNFISDKLKNAKDYEQAWYHVHTGTKAKKLTANGERLQKVNRVVFTNEGYKLGGEARSIVNKDMATKIWNNYVDGLPIKFEDLKFDGIDFYEYDTDFLTYLKNHKNIKLDFAIKESEGKFEKYVGVNAPYKKIPTFESGEFKTKIDDSKARKEAFEKIGSNKLAYYDEDNEKWEPIRVWKLSNKISQYPYLIGDFVNSSNDLKEFDYSRLNIDAYVSMAEAQLKLWKKTADVPVLGMTKIVDNILNDDKSDKPNQQNYR